MKARVDKFTGAAVALSLTMSLLLTGCGESKTLASKNQGKNGLEVSELRYQGAVGSVNFTELAEDLGYLAPLKLKYIGNTISGPQDIQSVVTGDIDFGGAFNGAVIKLLAAHAPITPVISYYGVDENTWSGYCVLDGSPIKTAKDLIGKKIAVNTLGAHHEFVIKEYLHRQGLTPKEIEQVTLVVVPPVTSEQTLRAKQIDVATLGSILRDKALERGGIHPLFTDKDLFGTFSAGTYVLTNRFIKENPKATRKFVEATAKAIEWARSTPRAEVVARFEKIIHQRGRKEDTSAVKFWKSTGIAGKGGVIATKEFSTWVDWLVKEGTLKKGQLDGKILFDNEFNPYSK
ncbi:ABC-type nitrate/sulfonate/bicarbonate transport system substrate-binding protein [Paenibacillus shirakamiensis]|uniref:ABC-type nitrate/sulfonate/bicarbonate transport system substrate-binding protein n=1 Tax=Paenibacillus shirakamiensis TaxID=1265935 RepID=A0ABS4JEV2_9BACL|nr:ABC transporter substrate-binding protein [Paenibacillus shirakamiensis]MBP2000238.1 ABC-type nitrate/sulfonate/bicarbonate transport system substrate-binding protein [Paenibacillus shirakamiensis]